MSRHVAIAITAAAFVTILVAGAGAGSTVRARSAGPGEPNGADDLWHRPGRRFSDRRCGDLGRQALDLRLSMAAMRLGGSGLQRNRRRDPSTRAASSADLGATLRVLVTATNRNGSAAATSAATAAVVSAPSAPRHLRRLRPASAC